MVKKPSNLYKKWRKKPKRLFASLFIKKSPNPIKKTKEKIEDKGQYKKEIF